MRYLNNISVCVPSYKRPDAVGTLDYLPFAKVYVDESEYKNYKANYKNSEIVSCPTGIQGNLCRIRNYILDTEFKNGADVVLLLDDDLKGVYRFENNQANMIQTDDFLGFVDKYSLLCSEFGFYFWGLNVNPDKQNYREYTPFSTVSYIGGPFQCHLKGSEIRYDEKLFLKEDYDMTLQHCDRYRGALRLNAFHYQAKQSVNVGGQANFRNRDIEEEQNLLLQMKWGGDIVKRDLSDRSHNSKKKKKHVDYNPVINIPIKGV